MTANQVQIRRDSSTNLDAATPAVGEIGYDSTNKRLRVGDGSTVGGLRIPNSIDIQGQSFLAAAASGTNTITMTVSPAPLAYANYQRFVFKAANNVTGSATINVNSLGAKTIKKRTTSGLSDLASGDIQQSGVYAVVYDGTYMQLEDYTQAQATSGLVLLGSAVASASATLEFESLITASYDNYLFLLKNLRPATDGVAFKMRTSTNNGSSYDSGASDYSSLCLSYPCDGSSSENAFNDASVNEISVAGTGGVAQTTIGSATTEGLNGQIWLSNPLNTAQYKRIHGHLVHGNASGQTVLCRFAGTRLAAADVDAVQYYMSSGNITSGEIEIYGYSS